MVASGTFGYGEEFRDFVDLKKLGVIVSKTITLQPRKGNPPPRTCETPSGMLNSIGLENPGFEGFIKEKLPLLAKIGVPVIVSIASQGDAEEFAILAKELEKIKEVSALNSNGEKRAILEDKDCRAYLLYSVYFTRRSPGRFFCRRIPSS